jgi:hypothetical protein
MGRDHFGYLDTLPEDIRDTFMWLCQELGNLTMKW